MYERVFDFYLGSTKSSDENHVYGVLTQLSRTSSDVLVKLDDDSIIRCHVQCNDRIPYLVEVVEYCEAFRIAVFVHSSLDYIASYSLEVEPDVFRAQISQNALRGEIYFLSMLRHIPFIQPVMKVQQVDAKDDAMRVSYGSALFGHQREAIQWMIRHEERIGNNEPVEYELAYALPRTGWFIDDVNMCFTQTPKRAAMHITGGILADGIGMGKTSTMLHMLMHGKKCVTAETDDAPYTSKGNLIIVPINLPSQWLTELDTFCGDNMKVVTLLQSKHLKQVTMTDILRADIVISTLSFLRHSQPYNDMIESTVLQHDSLRMPDRKLCCSLAAIQSRCRGANVHVPIVQAVHWKRVVVDEFHEIEATKDIEFLRQLKCDAFWGITASFNVVMERCHILDFLVKRPLPQHANAVSRTVSICIRSTRTCRKRPDMKLYKVRLPDATTAQINTLSLTDAVQFSTAAMDRYCFSGCSVSTPESLRRTHKRTTNQDTFFEQSVHELLTANVRCTICLENVCATITACGHLFCPLCISRHMTSKPSCPHCRAPLFRREVTHVVEDPCAKKLEVIAEMALELKSPVIVFVQWRRMLRSIKAVLLGYKLRVATLQGNLCQRRLSLQSFAHAGGVLLLCIEDSFAGLHLPSARHLIFAHALVGSPLQIAEMEEQAISRAVRPGQMNTVSIHSIVVAKTQEEDAWFMTHQQGSPPK